MQNRNCVYSVPGTGATRVEHGNHEVMNENTTIIDDESEAGRTRILFLTGESVNEV